MGPEVIDQRAGALLDASGLQPSSKGWWIRLEDFDPSPSVERFRAMQVGGRTA